MSLREENTVDWSLAYPRKQRSSEFNILLDGKDFDIYAGNIFAALLHASYGACWTMLLHRSCLKEHIRFATNFPTWEDYWFLCQLAEYNEIVFMDVATAENRGHPGERLTNRPDFVDPLKCHLEICKNIYLKSQSSFRPCEEEIRAKYQEIQVRLLKEYVKKGDLARAKSTRIAIGETDGFQAGMTDSLYRLLSYLPFNVVSHLVRAKRNISRVA
jgi:hypothetical protein